MSAPSQQDRSATGSADAEQAGVPPSGDTEEIDALPVLAEEATVVRTYLFTDELSRNRGAGVAMMMMPAVQAAAVAAGGFVAGAAVVGFVARRQRQSAALSRGRQAGRRLGRSGRARRADAGVGELVQIVGSRSLLLDVHLLGGRD